MILGRMADIFLSYSREDQSIARRFAEGFARAGLSVWWDQALAPGEAFDDVTEKALEQAGIVVVLWSRTSVTSRWVRAEATWATSENKLVPVMIEHCKRPIMFELTQSVELLNWQGRDDDPVWQGLVESLAQRAGKPRNYGARTSLPPSLPSASASLRVAVLPFADLSAARDQEYFSDGLTEEILNQLARIRELRVVGRTSSFSFKGRNEDLRDIARKLDVGHLLEGSVRKDADRLRITAQLVDGRDGSQHWSRTYDRKLASVFDLQEEIARDVASALSVSLEIGEASRARGGTKSLEAYDRYLQARQLHTHVGREHQLRAAQLCRDAISLDPGFSKAWLLLADLLPRTLLGVPPDKAGSIWAETAAANQRVQELTPEAWWARSVRAIAHLRRREYGPAETLVRTLLDEGPLTATDIERGWASIQLLYATGRLAEALRLQQSIARIEPRSLRVSYDLQRLLIANGANELAEQENERSLSLSGNLQPIHFHRLSLLIAKQGASADDIRAQYRKVVETQNIQMPHIDQIVAAHPDKVAVRAAIRGALDDPRLWHFSGLGTTATIADAYGEAELALEALHKQVNLGVDYNTVAVSLNHSGLRAHPRFKDLMRQLGLPDYWRQSGYWPDFGSPLGDDDFECH